MDNNKVACFLQVDGIKLILLLVNDKKLKKWIGCPIRYGMGVFGDKWSLLIIRDLMFKGKKYFGEFHDSEEEISTNILADRLVKLETGGLISKRRDAKHGSRFIYSLTEKGLDLIPMMLQMVDWSEKYDNETEVPTEFIESLRGNLKKFEADLRQELTEKLD